MRKSLVRKIFAVIFVVAIINFSFAMNFYDFVKDYVSQYTKLTNTQIPESYKYIKLNYKNVTGDVYETLQKAVYLDLLPNFNTTFPASKNVNQSLAVAFLRYKFKKGFFVYQSDQPATSDWLKYTLKNLISTQYNKNTNFFIDSPIAQKIDEILEKNYLYTGKLDETTMKYGAIQGMVDSIADNYTVYYPPKKGEKFMEELAGEYEGIGAVVKMYKPGQLVILSVFDGSPAQKAGLKKGDIVIAIDDEYLPKDISLEEIVSKIRGKAGTVVKLKVLRGEDVLDIKVVRGKVKMTTVSSAKNVKIPAGFCYVKIDEFNDTTYDLWKKTLQQLKLSACKNMILDLRDNPGGSLDQVQKILSYFVPSGQEIVKIKTKNDEIKLYSLYVGEYLPAKFQKIYVLINKWSASGAEILSKVMKEYNPEKVVLVGEKTYGKGTAQEVIQFIDHSALKYTFAKWLTPDGVCIDGKGVEPDIKVIDNPDTPEDEVIDWVIEN